jgi:magnesium transporter
MKIIKSAKIERISKNGVDWVNIENPGSRELTWLQDEFKIHDLDIEDISSTSQLPRIDEYPTYLYIILNLPHYSHHRQRTFPQKLDILIGEDYVITISQGDIKTLNLVFDQVQSQADRQNEFFSQGSGFLLYKIITALLDYQFPMLTKIQKKMEQVEEDFFEGRVDQETLSIIALIKQDIISFKKITKPQRGVISGIDAKHKRFIPGKLEVYYDDAYDKIERIWEQLENYKEVIESFEKTVESYFSHRTNDIIRTLTIFSVVMLPLTFITGFYGMNISLPGLNNSATFLTLIALMVILVAGMLIYFKKKNWL